MRKNSIIESYESFQKKMYEERIKEMEEPSVLNKLLQKHPLPIRHYTRKERMAKWLRGIFCGVVRKAKMVWWIFTDENRLHEDEYSDE